MKQALIAVCVVLTMFAGGSTFIAVKSSNSASANAALLHRFQSDATAAKSKLDEITANQAIDQKTIAFLQGEISKLRSDLSNSTAEFFAASERADDLQNRLEEEKEASKRYAASVPKPEYLKNGRAYFTKVVGVHGGIVFTNATYSMTFGSRVLFKLSNGSLNAVFVDDLHPLVLTYLGIDADAARAKQHQLDAATEASRQVYYEEVARQQQARAIASVAEAKIAIELQTAADEKAARDAALETERIKANAAMVEAKKPPNQINIIQQSQQSQRVGY